MHTYDCGHKASGYGQAVRARDGRVVCVECDPERATPLLIDADPDRYEEEMATEAEIAADIARAEIEAYAAMIEAATERGMERTMFQIDDAAEMAARDARLAGEGW